MQPEKPAQTHQPQLEDDAPLEDRGRGLGLRLLALLGALSFVMLGLSSLAPLLYPVTTPETTPEPTPAPRNQQQAPVS